MKDLEPFPRTDEPDIRTCADTEAHGQLQNQSQDLLAEGMLLEDSFEAGPELQAEEDLLVEGRSKKQKKDRRKKGLHAGPSKVGS